MIRDSGQTMTGVCIKSAFCINKMAFRVNCNRKAENNCDFTYCTKILMDYC